MSNQSHIYTVADWPLYSGLLVTASGWAALVLVMCCRYYYPGYAQSHPCVFPVKTYSIVSFFLVAKFNEKPSLHSGVERMKWD